jgi:RNA polymerase sigma-70 factor (ECF subfamily)
MPPNVNGAVVDATPDRNGLPTRMENREEVEKLLTRLDAREANVVRMYHLEGKSYAQISQVVGIAENSVGPVLSRARDKMRDGE